MPKITKAGGPSYESDITPPPGFTGTWGEGESEHPGTGEPMEEVEVPVGESAEIHGDGSGDTLSGTDATPAEGDAANNDVASDAEPAGSALPRPAANAPKADWLAYARQETGEDIDDGDYTKAELVDLVGKD